MTKARNKRQLNWLILLTVLIVIVATPIIVLTNLDVASKQLAKQVPIEWEQQLGESSFKQYSLQTELMPQKQSEKLKREVSLSTKF